MTRAVIGFFFNRVHWPQIRCSKPPVQGHHLEEALGGTIFKWRPSSGHSSRVRPIFLQILLIAHILPIWLTTENPRQWIKVHFLTISERDDYRSVEILRSLFFSNVVIRCAHVWATTHYQAVGEQIVACHLQSQKQYPLAG